MGSKEFGEVKSSLIIISIKTRFAKLDILRLNIRKTSPNQNFIEAKIVISFQCLPYTLNSLESVFTFSYLQLRCWLITSSRKNQVFRSREGLRLRIQSRQSTHLGKRLKPTRHDMHTRLALRDVVQLAGEKSGSPAVQNVAASVVQGRPRHQQNETTHYSRSSQLFLVDSRPRN